MRHTSALFQPFPPLMGFLLPGFWTRDDCSECAPWYYGPRCAQQCPGGATQPCTGHGLCSTGPQGNGTCSCDFGYGGLDCALQCPGLLFGVVRAGVHLICSIDYTLCSVCQAQQA